MVREGEEGKKDRSAQLCALQRTNLHLRLVVNMSVSCRPVLDALTLLHLQIPYNSNSLL